MKFKETKLVDNITGEIHYIKKEPVSYFNNDGYLFLVKQNHSRVFNEIRIPSEIFIDSELGKIYRLQAYIQNKTNLMIKRTNKGYRPMTLEELVTITGLNERSGKEFIKKLIDNKIMARVTIETGDRITVHYVFNPIYFHNGNRLSVSLYNTFKEEIDPYIAEWVKLTFKEQTNEITTL